MFAGKHATTNRLVRRIGKVNKGERVVSLTSSTEKGCHQENTKNSREEAQQDKKRVDNHENEPTSQRGGILWMLQNKQ